MRSGLPCTTRDLVALLLAAFALALTGCGDDPPTEPPPSAAEVEVRPSGAVVSELDGTVTLEAVALDADGGELTTDPDDVAWRSTNPVVATVDAGGTVTARATGQVTITAELDEVTGHAVLTVNQPATQPVSEWERVASPTTERLLDVWGSAPDDVWAVGLGGVILHYDGTAWSAVPNPAEEREFFVDLFGIWGTGPDDVWAVGDAGFLHYDGTSWTLAAESTERLFDVWGSGPNDVWVGATDGETSHYDGTAWRGVTNPTDKALFGVWEMTPGDLWVVGLEGEILRGRR